MPIWFVTQGVVQVEKLKTPEDFIPTVLDRVKREYLCRVYKLKGWTSPHDFLDQVARRTGKLLKLGEPDINAVARMVLNDWQRGKLPFFVPPPNLEGDAKKESESTVEAVEESTQATAAPQEKEESPSQPEKKKFEPRLAQDFSKIRVDLKYEGDDVRPLEEQPELLEGEDDLSADEEENEGEDKAELKKDAASAPEDSKVFF